MASELLSTMAHYFFLLALPPFLLGVIAKTKAFFAGRKGPPLLQAYYDIAKLLKKGAVFSQSGSFITRIAPLVILPALWVAGSLLPLAGGPPLHFEGDLILFAYLLGLTRFMTILAALDVGSSFEGMGASREATFGALTDLAFFLGLVVLGVLNNSTSLAVIFRMEANHALWQPASLLLFLSFFLVLLTENSRMPIDDPNTHLELTMIHEVMILDYSGPDLGLMLYGASVKLFLFMALAASVLWPAGNVFGLVPVALFFLKLILVAVLIGIVEATNARVRLMKVPQLLMANFVATALALLVVYFGKGF